MLGQLLSGSGQPINLRLLIPLRNTDNIDNFRCAIGQGPGFIKGNHLDFGEPFQRVALPDDVKDAEVIVRDREQILADAQRQAEQIIADAQQQFEQMVSHHAIVQAAQRRANAIVKDAVAKADEEADSCTAYLNDVLGNVEQHLKRVLDDVHQNRLEVTSGGDGGNNAARSGR